MDTSQYKCPNCDGELEFNPSTQEISCPFCRSSFTMETIKQIYAENPAPQPHQADDFEEHTNVYHCTTCGADIMADDQTTATFCYYCHSPVILSGRLTGDYKPSKVIGFRVTKENALASFKSWCASKPFIPSDFKSEQQLEKMTGLYVPFWLADCNVSADYNGTGSVKRSWTSGNYRYTETKEFAVQRKANIVTTGVPADGESKIDDKLMESIEPFNYDDLKDFSMSYFTGFFADKYDVDKAGVFPNIKERVTSACKSVIRNSVTNYSSVAVHSETYNINKTDWQYIMLPVWFMTYKYNDKIYEFAINGQTGKLAGTPPLDKKKLFMASVLTGLCVVLALFLGGQLFI